jgi:predicted Zn-dependent protease
VTAYRLRAQGKFADAERTLLEFLFNHPSNIQARLLLIRLYAQDLKQLAKAEEALARLERLPHVPAWQVDYARTSIYDWANPQAAAPEPPPIPLPESIEELLLRGFPGTAIEKLEHKIKEQPGDFDSWLKLAEARGRYCGDIHSAEKIVRKIQGNRAFTPEQIQLAQARLTEWRAAKPPARI